MQIAENSTKQVNEKINNQISTTSNQEEWDNIIKAHIKMGRMKQYNKSTKNIS